MISDEDPIAKDVYDELADEYDQAVRPNLHTADLEFSATTSLIPDVDGKRVLDAGCGTGVYTEWLLDQEAKVVGVDVSEEMLNHAIKKVDTQAEFHQADLEKPLGFAAENAFDGIVSALALDYVKNWRQTFTEFARILNPGGFIVFSVLHPRSTFSPDKDKDYLEVEMKQKEWTVDVPYYRRPFSEIINPLPETGFQIDTVCNPQPTEEFEENPPELSEKKSRHSVFLCVRAVKQ
jgi:ubiquinone/menaquinone biosynthesis C-methylase UbiE